jgi:hypothetical protein
MTNTARALFLAGALTASAVPAGAQSAAPSGKAFLSVNLGAQPNRRTITVAQSFSLYGETAKCSRSAAVIG